MSFASPTLAMIALLVPVAVVLIALLDRGRRKLILGRLGEHDAVRRMMASASPGRRLTKRIIQTAGVTLIVLAAARPQVKGTARRGSESLDLVIALDVSKSMLVKDVAGDTRLARGRQLIKKLLAELPDDRVAPLVFAGAAAHFPLSDDKDVAADIMNDLGPADLPGGSDLREAVRVAGCLLRPDVGGDNWSDECGDVGGRGHGGDPLPGDPDDGIVVHKAAVEKSERSKVILLVTDGADGLGGGGQGEEGAAVIRQVRDAVGAGIVLIVVGIGSEQGGLVPDLDYKGEPSGVKHDDQGNEVTSKLDRESLQLLAEAAGDRKRYFEDTGASAEPDPRPILDALGALQRGALIEEDREVMDDLYHYFLFPGFMLLVIEACIGTRRRVRYPEAP